MAQWEFSPSGRVVTFSSVEAKGKTFLRADGRIVTRPLGVDEQERLFEFEGAHFRLARVDGGLDLQMIAAAAPADALANQMFPQAIEGAPRGWSWSDLTTSQTPPASVVLRARIYFAVALLFLIYSGSTIWRFRNAQDDLRRAENLQRVFDRTEPDARSSERVGGTAAMITSAFKWEALLALAGMIFAPFLVRGFRWASFALEAVTWLAFIILTVTLMRLDLVMHVQMNSAFDPVRAAAVVSRTHRSDIVAAVMIALIAGGLLHLVGHRTVGRLYDEESY